MVQLLSSKFSKYFLRRSVPELYRDYQKMVGFYSQMEVPCREESHYCYRSAGGLPSVKSVVRVLYRKVLYRPAPRNYYVVCSEQWMARIGISIGISNPLCHHWGEQLQLNVSYHNHLINSKNETIHRLYLHCYHGRLWWHRCSRNHPKPTWLLLGRLRVVQWAVSCNMPVIQIQ